MPGNRPIFKHKADPAFWDCYRVLLPEVQEVASKNFELLKSDPRHPSLQFKKIGKLWSVRVGRDFRALGVAIDEGYLWIWIGPHDEYIRILKG